MASRLRLLGLRTVLLPAPTRAAASPALLRAFASSARSRYAVNTPTKPPPMVGTAGAPQIDPMTGEVTGGADIDVSLEAKASPGSFADSRGGCGGWARRTEVLGLPLIQPNRRLEGMQEAEELTLASAPPPHSRRCLRLNARLRRRKSRSPQPSRSVAPSRTT